ncbi:DUF3987 domain-containing protein [Variovorax sp. PAMC26660]|uniref:DUF3987 domain-containing protein n=1 Tax=Variovorax sp. PAMC26660 TaxID=2762322 RepID=UPI00164EAEA6|nr:DUF3987 domain-containing protein [Variovorax sp. PAMC26660]QNK67608.1 DUF3987 domain-containing protein [Variovorax sp. PAMC26660]
MDKSSLDDLWDVPRMSRSEIDEKYGSWQAREEEALKAVGLAHPGGWATAEGCPISYEILKPSTPWYEEPRAPPFPTDYLLEPLREAVEEVRALVGAPAALISGSLIASLSAVCQAGIKVQRPGLEPSSCGLFLVTVAESGERKTAVDNIFTAPLRNFQEKVDLQMSESRLEFKAKHRTWTAQVRKANRLYNKASGGSEATALIELHKLNRQEPTPPVVLKLLQEAATFAAFKRAFSQCVPVTSLISSEGLNVTKSGAMEELGFLNSLWDGRNVHLKNRDYDIAVKDPRFTLGLMIQPQGFEKLIAKRDGEFAESGMLARCLVSHPESTQGQRYGILRKSRNYVQKILKNFDALLAQQALIDFDVRQAIILTFDHRAAQAWISFVRHLEESVTKGGRFKNIRSAAAKAAENAARLAALFSKMESDDPNIRLYHITSAIKLVIWHLNEMNYVLFERKAFDQLKSDADQLLNFLEKRWTMTDFQPISRTEIAHYGPGRPKISASQRARTLEYLVRENRIVARADGIVRAWAR